METSEKTFQILEALGTEEISTQRQLAEHAGMSLGQVNFILKSLLDKGLVKIGNFRRNPYKIGYMYLLTPKGIRTKSRLAVKFVMHKLKEYETLRDRLAEKLGLLEKEGRKRIVLVAPDGIGDFMNFVMRERNLDLSLTAQIPAWTDLKSIAPGSFDVVLLFDDTLESLARVSEVSGVPREKLSPLW